jgi:hypothetical protein
MSPFVDEDDDPKDEDNADKRVHASDRLRRLSIAKRRESRERW